MTATDPTPRMRGFFPSDAPRFAAVCTTETTEGKECGAESSTWDTPMQRDQWMREHADEFGHESFNRSSLAPTTVRVVKAEGAK
ncbi:DUF7848 domain-containing protein [Streptomyces sp. CB02923]|uniref:DUF7848 domain-containing protein n=1 Tax=Streptomyces sp. CB02923 TaxID=1718985 RepID=UPI00093D09F8|nr:hypothetical protein [Streptomyces sp. CB02923]